MGNLINKIGGAMMGLGIAGLAVAVALEEYGRGREYSEANAEMVQMAGNSKYQRTVNNIVAGSAILMLMGGAMKELYRGSKKR